MPDDKDLDDKDLLEEIDENSMADFDSLEGFAEIDDLTALEGIEEFQDLEELTDLGDLDIPLPDEIDEAQDVSQDASTEEIPVPDMDEMADRIGEMNGKAPEGLFEDSTPDSEEELSDVAAETPEERENEPSESDMDTDGIADAIGEMTGTAPEGLFDESTPQPEEDLEAVIDAIDDTAEEMPLPESAEESADDISDDIDDMAEEVALPELEDVDTGSALEDAVDDLPLPEDEDVTAAIDAIDNMVDEMPLPDLEDEDTLAAIDAIDDMADEMPLPDLEDEDASSVAIDAINDTVDEMPLPDFEDGDASAAIDAIDEMPLPDDEEGTDAAIAAIDDMMAEIPMPEEEGEVDDMLDGLLDDLAVTDSGAEDGFSGDNPEDASDLLDLLENSEDTLLEEDIDEVLNIGLPETEAEQKPQEQEPGLLKRLFGNVVNDEIAEAERQAEEQEKEVAAEKAEQDAIRKEEKAAQKAEKDEQKAAKKAAKAEQRAAKKAAKEAAKAEKKAKKEEEAAQEEQFEVTGKLNKVGVAIIAIFTVVFLTTEILGTNLHGVNRAKRAANSYFKLGKYTQAYQEILGTDLKKKDPDTYNKIKTVMQVQRAINAYQNYNEMNYYPDALNALLRGIERYDTNLESAKELDVVSDMDQCRAQILSLLNSEFSVSEQEAYALLALDQNQYTTKVVQLAMDAQ